MKEEDDRVCIGKDGRNCLKVVAFLIFIFAYFVGYFSVLIFPWNQ